MLYTPHTRVFLSAVPVFSGSAISGFIEVEDPRMSARLWEFIARDQQKVERTNVSSVPGAPLRLAGIRRSASRAQAA
jgi:hypothetical protein